MQASFKVIEESTDEKRGLGFRPQARGATCLSCKGVLEFPREVMIVEGKMKGFRPRQEGPLDAHACSFLEALQFSTKR